MNSDHTGGYEAKIFVVQPSDKCLCGLCLSVLKNPVQCSNGHCFCEGCINHALRTKKNCPMCDVSLSVQTLSKNLFVRGMIEEMKTFCPSCDDLPLSLPSNGDCCAWTGELHIRSKHYEESCDFKLVKCINQECDEKVLKKNFAAHFSVCPSRFVECTDCHLAIMQKNMAQHSLVCLFRMVDCVNSCGLQLKFKDLESHLLSCPLQLIDCPLSKLGLCDGCAGKQPRNAIKEHIVGGERVPETLFQLATHNVALTDQVSLLTNQNNYLFEHLQGALARMDQMTADVAARFDDLNASEVGVHYRRRQHTKELLMKCNMSEKDRTLVLSWINDVPSQYAKDPVLSSIGFGSGASNMLHELLDFTPGVGFTAVYATLEYEYHTLRALNVGEFIKRVMRFAPNAQCPVAYVELSLTKQPLASGFSAKEAVSYRLQHKIMSTNGEVLSAASIQYKCCANICGNNRLHDLVNMKASDLPLNHNFYLSAAPYEQVLTIAQTPPNDELKRRVLYRFEFPFSGIVLL